MNTLVYENMYLKLTFSIHAARMYICAQNLYMQ
jgi:hypothetical protein